MRPRELTISGFRSYASEAVFSWEGRGLVGVVGPIGSGKTSILDAISFALYNQTPRTGNRTKALINQRRDAAQVALTFDVDGSTYRAVRSLRRSGAPAHALYRVDGDDQVEMADRATEMLEKVEVLLGLDFAAFQRSVLLAQNQFAGFLDATAGERDQVLKGVFGFDRLDAMRGVAKGRLDQLGNRLAVLADRRATADSDRADLAKRQEELEAAEERARVLEELRTPFEEAKELIAGSEERRRASAAELARLDELRERIPDREEAQRVFAATSDGGEAVEAGEKALEEAGRARAESAERLDEALAAVGGREGLVAAGDLVATWRAAADRATLAAETREAAEERLAKEQGRLAEARQRAEEASAAAQQASAREREAEAQVEGSDRALSAARQEHRAHALRVDLVEGEPCPVCEQSVTTLPTAETPVSLDEATGALEAARAARSDASVVAREASELAARLKAEAESADAAVDEAQAAVERAREQEGHAASASREALEAVAEVLGEGDPGEALAVVRSGVAEAEEALQAAVDAETRARARLEAARDAARSSEAALAGLRTGLATLAGLLDADIEVGESVVSVEEALGTLRSEWIERRAAAEEARDKAAEEAAAGKSALSDLLEAADLASGDDLAEVIAAAVAERTTKEAEVNLLEKRLADLDRLAEDEAELVESSELLRTLHADLAPSRFLDFVLDERRRVLGDLASEHFELLSAGRYRFDESGEFDVVDLTAADTVRGSDSLSGGETFLASLALALALAEIVSREGGRLDAFFLDEGFGSLDPEHLDLAMGGIERLVTAGPDRLVVVVSHVPALNERIEDLIQLDRDPDTGDTVVVSGASVS